MSTVPPPSRLCKTLIERYKPLLLSGRFSYIGSYDSKGGGRNIREFSKCYGSEDDVWVRLIAIIMAHHRL
jgi:hypothetical protein